MEIRERNVSGVVSLDVIGRLVLTGTRLERPLCTVVDQLLAAGRQRVMVNLAGVSQVDTSGLAELVGAHRAVVRGGARLVVIAPPGRPRELLELTRLDHVLEVSDSEEAAVRRLAADATSWPLTADC
jgi:anti-sigma B factor antagonist